MAVAAEGIKTVPFEGEKGVIRRIFRGPLFPKKKNHGFGDVTWP
jgi:hypothetical protein